MALMPLDEAQRELLADCRPIGESEIVGLGEAAGRTLAADQRALIDVPPVDNAAMDGYALRAADAGKVLPQSDRIAAGDYPGPLKDASVARIFTGAPVPEGADAVVMQEDTSQEHEGVRIPSTVRLGQHIRRRGQDCFVGDSLLAAGRRLRPQDVGLLASQGLAEVPVYRKLRIALLSSGSELYEPGVTELPLGAIYNSNRPMLGSLLESLGFEVVDCGIVEDTLEATTTALAEAAEKAEAIISTGGVSVGEADFLREAVEALGALNLWKIAIKPGKPFAYGHVAGTPYLGLPGNPSSSFVTFALLARPYLCRMQGRTEFEPRWIQVPADFHVDRAGSRTEFLRVLLPTEAGKLVARPYANQSSGILRSVSASEGLACVQAGRTLEVGENVPVLLLDSLLF